MRFKRYLTELDNPIYKKLIRTHDKIKASGERAKLNAKRRDAIKALYDVKQFYDLLDKHLNLKLMAKEIQFGAVADALDYYKDMTKAAQESIKDNNIPDAMVKIDRALSHLHIILELFDVNKNPERFLKEDYEMSFTRTKFKQGQYVEIFSNPTSRDFRDASQQRGVRFAADMKKKKVYIWDPYVLHAEVAQGALTDYSDRQFGRWIMGTAENKGGKWVMIDQSGASVGPHLDVNPPERWKWVDKYIQVTDYLDNEYKWRKDFLSSGKGWAVRNK